MGVHERMAGSLRKFGQLIAARRTVVSIMIVFGFTFVHMLVGAARIYFWDDDWNYFYKVQQVSSHPLKALVLSFQDVGHLHDGVLHGWTFYRPLAILGWALLYRLCGLNPAGYSVFIFTAYFAVSVFVFLFGKRLQGVLGGFLGAVVYMTSFLTGVKVLWRANLAHMLMTALAAASLYYFWSFLEEEDRLSRLVVSLCLGMLAFLTCEESAFIPAVMFFLCLFRTWERGWKGGCRAAPWSAFALAAGWWLLYFTSRIVLSIPFKDTHMLVSVENVLQNASAYLGFYFRYHNLLLLAAAGLSLMLGRQRLLKAGLMVWACLALVPILLLDFNTEYYLVLAMPGLCAVMGAAIGELFELSRRPALGVEIRHVARWGVVFLCGVVIYGAVSNVRKTWEEALLPLIRVTNQRREQLEHWRDTLPFGATLELQNMSEDQAHFYGVALKVLGRRDIKLDLMPADSGVACGGQSEQNGSMTDELKSAWELALEKLDAQQDLRVEKLTEEQKKAIAEIRTKYKARIAETEIHWESKIKQAVLAGAFDELQRMKGQLAQEKARLNREMEREIEKIRDQLTTER